MDQPTLDTPSANGSSAGTLFAKAFGVVFCVIFIIGAIAIGSSAKAAGAPAFFTLGGYGFAILGAIMLIRILTLKPTAPGAATDASAAAATVIHHHHPPPASQRTVCESCGARRLANEASCRYCGCRL